MGQKNSAAFDILVDLPKGEVNELRKRFNNETQESTPLTKIWNSFGKGQDEMDQKEVENFFSSVYDYMSSKGDKYDVQKVTKKEDTKAKETTIKLWKSHFDLNKDNKINKEEFLNTLICLLTEGKTTQDIIDSEWNKAISKGSLEDVQNMLFAHRNLSQRAVLQGKTALEVVVNNKKEDTTKALVTVIANSTTVDDWMRSLKTVVIDNEYEFIYMLLESCPVPKAENNRSVEDKIDIIRKGAQRVFYYAAINGKMEIMEKILKQYPHININPVEYDMHLLSKLASMLQLPVTKFLLKKAQEQEQWALGELKKQEEELVQWKKEVEVERKAGNTVKKDTNELSEEDKVAAAKRENELEKETQLRENNIGILQYKTQMVANLISSGSQKGDVFTPVLYIALQTQKEDEKDILKYVLYLLKKGFSPNSGTVDNVTKLVYTPLALAVRLNLEQVSVALLKKRADINAINSWKSNSKLRTGTALHIAVRLGYLNMVELLLANRADLEIKNEKGLKPIDLAKDASIKKLINSFC